MLTPQQAQRLVVSIEQEPADSVGPDVVRASPDASQHRTPPSAKPPLPERIGPYRIIRLIAHGGMGAVYEGEQDHPHRRVAIKVMNAATLLNAHTKDASRRFHNEVEFLGRLEHPNIARLYDAGLHDEGFGGLPYFAMEYLADAHPITNFARDNRLDIRRRLELFIQACDGVQHGHQRGIVHRDLKPSNILVTGASDGEAANPPSPSLPVRGRGAGGEGVDDDAAPVAPCESAVERNDDLARNTNAVPAPTTNPSPRLSVSSSLSSTVSSSLPTAKIIDFGVARATDADMSIVTQHTATGHLVGTLQYMSPEQCDGDSRELDTRSDVYALGAVLYELLCERLPYDLSHMTITGAAKIIQLQEPPAPHKWNRKLRGDLEAIILKAMHKNRDRRYGTAGELATDIRRHMNGEPIVARKPGPWMKATRWMARHPVMTTAAVCAAFIALTTIATVVSVSLVRSQPYSIAVDSNNRKARLLSFTEECLFEWDSGANGGICNAYFADRPGLLGGGRVAVIGFNSPAQNPGLWFFRVDSNDEEPIVIRLTNDDLVPHDRDAGFLGESFCVNQVQLLDVFSDKEHPGNEVVAVFQHNPSSVCAVVVSDLAGHTLWRIWHDGNIQDLEWVSTLGVLVLSGLNGEGFWHERGQFGLTSGRHPVVVFGVSPCKGNLARSYVGSTDATTANWYKCLMPAEVSELGPSLKLSVARPDDPPNTCRLAMELTTLGNAGLSWALDANTGTLVPDTMSLGNSWRTNTRVPNPAILRLDQLPPLSHEATAGAESQPIASSRPWRATKN